MTSGPCGYNEWFVLDNMDFEISYAYFSNYCIGDICATVAQFTIIVIVIIRPTKSCAIPRVKYKDPHPTYARL